MYIKLTKIIEVDGAQCVACAFFGTKQCYIHTTENTPDGGHCNVLAAILNQLHAFEDLINDEKLTGKQYNREEMVEDGA